MQDLETDEMRENLQYEQIPKNLQFPSQGVVYFNQFIFPQRIIRPSKQDENLNLQSNLPLVAGERRPDRAAPV